MIFFLLEPFLLASLASVFFLGIFHIIYPLGFREKYHGAKSQPRHAPPRGLRPASTALDTPASTCLWSWKYRLYLRRRRQELAPW